MDIFKFFWEFVQVILTPTCWLQNYPYSKTWDKELRRLLKTETFTPYAYGQARLGKKLIWVTNHPYASFTLEPSTGVMVRPSRRTILKAYDKLIEDLQK